MQRQIQLIRQLVSDSQYTVDPAAVAAAILARARARGAVMEVAFRNDLRSPYGHGREPSFGGPRVRSFRPSRQARSFRPCNLKSLTQ